MPGDMGSSRSLMPASRMVLLDHARRRRSNTRGHRIGPGARPGICGVRQNPLHILLAGQGAAAPLPGSKHGERVGVQHFLPHHRHVGVSGPVVRDLERGRLAGRACLALKNLHPAVPFHIRAKQHHDIIDLDPEGHGGPVGRKIRDSLFRITFGWHQAADGFQEGFIIRIARRERPDFTSAAGKNTAIGNRMRWFSFFSRSGKRRWKSRRLRNRRL